MWLQFFLENTHFAINLFAALVFFAIFWLYFDAWLGRKSKAEGIKIFGYLLLSLSYVIGATLIESTVITSPSFNSQINALLVALLRIPGFVLIIISQGINPLMEKPQTTGLNTERTASAGFLTGATSLNIFWLFSYPILSFTTGLMYLIRATVGLEDHLKKVALGFFLLSLADFVGLAEIWRGSDNVTLFNFAKPFGIAWVLEQTFLLLAVLLLGKWVLGYLLKRIQSQLFMVFSISILIIFLLTTVSFTFLLLNNLQKDNLKKLETDVKVLNFAIDSKKAEALSDAEVVAQNSVVITALDNKDRSSLANFSQSFLLTKKHSSLVITNENGQVVARGEDSKRIGESLSSDSLIKRALLGNKGSSVISNDGVLAPQVYVRAGVPIKSKDKIIGVVVTSSILDNAFVDGVKGATGLQTAIYGGNKLSATTTVSADSKSRPIGIKESSKIVNEVVLTKGQPHSGGVNLLNVPYFAAYLPLKDIDNNPVGMLFVGSGQIEVLKAAGQSVELTFIVTVVLLLLAIFPAYFISRYIANQVR